MKDSHPVRPGVPQFGRPIGVSGTESLANKGPLAGFPDTSFPMTPLSQKELAEQAKVDIVNRVADGFFMQKPALSLKSSDINIETVQSPVGGMAPELNSLDEALLMKVDEQEKSGDVPEYVRPGRYLDVSV